MKKKNKVILKYISLEHDAHHIRPNSHQHLRLSPKSRRQSSGIAKVL